jgi:hypothetical protein
MQVRAKHADGPERSGSQAIYHSPDFRWIAAKVPRRRSRMVRSSFGNLRAWRASAADLRQKICLLCHQHVFPVNGIADVVTVIGPVASMHFTAPRVA